MAMYESAAVSNEYAEQVVSRAIVVQAAVGAVTVIAAELETKVAA
ncbi:MAG: hypothetical protein ACREGD_04230 [Candidatus Saccharimonadales bacterium]